MRGAAIRSHLLARSPRGLDARPHCSRWGRSSTPRTACTRHGHRGPSTRTPGRSPPGARPRARGRQRPPRVRQAL